MGFEEKQRRRGGKFGEVNDFAGRVFQGTAQLSRLLMAGGGKKNSGGGGKQKGRPTFILGEGAGEKMEQKNKRYSVLSRTIVHPRPCKIQHLNLQRL